MKYGAIAVLDALGFKGIWSRYGEHLIFRKLKQAKDVAADKFSEGNNTASFFHLFEGFPFKSFYRWEARFLSDTALFALMPPSELESPASSMENVERWRSMQSYFVLCDLMYVISNFLNYVGCTCQKPALAYRGCISIGEFQIEDEFVLGPAIDEAAELSGVADGAFCWLTPRAFAEFQVIHYAWQEFANCAPGCPSHDELESLAPLYDVPLKDGSTCQSRVVNPLATLIPSHRQDFITELISTFVPPESPAVARKRKHTEEFLRMALGMLPHPVLLGKTLRPLNPR